jgi:interferon gamma-inducible protein 30
MQPLLQSAGAGRTQQRRSLLQTLLGLAALAAVSVAFVALALSAANRIVILQGDGVVPVRDLSFTKALKEHSTESKKLDDVAARSAMSAYYDSLNEEYQSEHKAALKRYFNTRQSLMRWFDVQGQKLHQETEEEKLARKASHPGKLGGKPRSSEDPDDVPLAKQQSSEDRMIRQFADYQRVQEVQQAAKAAKGRAAHIAEKEKMISYKRKQQQASAAAAEAAAVEHDVQKRKQGDYKEALENRDAKKKHSPAKKSTSSDRKAAEAQAKAAETARQKELVEEHIKFERQEEEIKEQARENAKEIQDKRKQELISRKKARDAEHAKFKAKLAKDEEEKKALIARNHKNYIERKAAEKARFHGETDVGMDANVPLQDSIERAKAIQSKGSKAPLQIKESPPAKKVKIDFYMESMCPGCKYYTKNVLGSLLDKPDFRSMVDFTVYPYGNGRLTGDSIQCQHGSDECYGNTILACMQDIYPLTEQSLGFVPAFVCMEGLSGKPVDDFKKCAASNDIDAPKVLQCADGEQGKALAVAAAQKTEALNPPHEYAPWVTLNGQPMRDEAYSLQENVCKAYDAGELPAPALCSAKSLKALSKRKRAILHDGGGRGFSVCENSIWDK